MANGGHRRLHPAHSQERICDGRRRRGLVDEDEGIGERFQSSVFFFDRCQCLRVDIRLEATHAIEDEVVAWAV